MSHSFLSCQVVASHKDQVAKAASPVAKARRASSTKAKEKPHVIPIISHMVVTGEPSAPHQCSMFSSCILIFRVRKNMDFVMKEIGELRKLASKQG